jgi:hypothetical protein
VFENNIPSVKLWSKLGFKIVGIIPEAGRLEGSTDLVNAFVFHYDFTK